MLDLTPQIENMKRHIAADELVRGIGFEEGKGCFVGCTIDAYDHKLCEERTGVPEWLWYLCDTLHEQMSDEIDRGVLALSLLRGFERCEDFAQLERGIHISIQRLNLERVKAQGLDAGVKAKVLAAIEQVIANYEAKLSDDDSAWSAARSAADSAADSAARSEARLAASSAAWSAAWSASWSAARSAADSAADSAARSAADSAADSAAWSAADSAADSAAYSAEYDTIGRELLRLLGEPVQEVRGE